MLAGWMAVFSGQTAGGATVGGDRRRGLVRSRARGRLGVVRVGAGHVRAGCVPPVPSRCWPTGSFAVAQEPPWSFWRDTALCMQAEALLLTGDVDQAAAVFTEASPLAVAMSNTDSLVDSEAELAHLGDGPWPVDGGGRTRGTGTRRHRRESPARLRHQRARLRRRGPARCHRGDLNETNRQLTQAMRARPSLTFALPYLAVRARLQLAKVHWAIADQMTARHLLLEIDDILLHRPALGTLVEQVAEFRPTVASAAQVGAAHASPLTPAELRLLPYLQTHLNIREIAARLFISATPSTPRSRRSTGTGRLLAAGRGTTSDGDRSARRVAELNLPAAFRRLVVSYPSAIASFGAAATTWGIPTTG